jgi:hypothetical protein
MLVESMTATPRYDAVQALVEALEVIAEHGAQSTAEHACNMSKRVAREALAAYRARTPGTRIGEARPAACGNDGHSREPHANDGDCYPPRPPDIGVRPGLRPADEVADEVMLGLFGEHFRRNPVVFNSRHEVVQRALEADRRSR